MGGVVNMVFEFVAGWAAKKGLDKVYQRVVDWFTQKQERGVLILGAGGVGKTTLASLLSGKLDGRELAEYTESVGTEEFTLEENTKVQIIVPPGQSWRRPSTWDVLLERVRQGEFRGIVLIGAFGHHAIGDFSYKNHKLYDHQRGLEGFLTSYVDECRKQEELILKQLCSNVSLCEKPIWLLTLVSKQDLWWDERDKVEAYYSSGKYGDLVQKCLGRKSENAFRHECSFVSLVIRNLETGRGERLKATVAGYDTPTQQKSLEKLLDTITALMEWESQHGKL